MPMATKAAQRKSKSNAGERARWSASRWLRRRATDARAGLRRLFKPRRKASGRTVVGHVGKKRPFEVGRVVALVALTVLVGEFFAKVSRLEMEAPCALPYYVSNQAIAPHWANIREWCPYIMKASADYDLDPRLLAALILVESGGQPRVYSRSGAVGLMQVMPRDGIAATFQCASGPCFAERPSIRELEDPAFNVDYGARLLANNITRTGSVRDALEAYGPNNVGYDYADKVLSIYQALK